MNLQVKNEGIQYAYKERVGDEDARQAGDTHNTKNYGITATNIVHKEQVKK
jgi:hypothetical protein